MKRGSWTGVAFSFNTGAVVPEADVEVRRELDGALASISSDADGLVPIAQPGFEADAQGMIHFYAPASKDGYQIKVTMGAEERVLRHQAIGNAAQVDTTDYTATVLSAEDAAEARTLLEVYSQAEVDALVSDTAKLLMPTSGRLTLTSGVPVTAADVTAAATVYFTPYKGNVIQLYDGSSWVPKIFAELSQATSDTTKSPAAVAADSNYDVFVWDDGGTLRATRGPAWSSATARGTGAGTTELELFEGRYVNKVAITNGPAARHGLYVGTIRSTAASQIEDSKAKRYVWNNYNRVPRQMSVFEATVSWAYSSSTLRQVRASTANQLDFVRGLDEDAVHARANARFSGSGADQGTSVCGIGLDSTTAIAAGATQGQARTSNTNSSQAVSDYNGLPGIGRHFLAWLEAGVSSTTFQGSDRSGIMGEMPA